jgi:hypothetical protein
MALSLALEHKMEFQIKKIKLNYGWLETTKGRLSRLKAMFKEK